MSLKRSMMNKLTTITDNTTMTRAVTIIVAEVLLWKNMYAKAMRKVRMLKDSVNGEISWNRIRCLPPNEQSTGQAT